MPRRWLAFTSSGPLLYVGAVCGLLYARGLWTFIHALTALACLHCAFWAFGFALHGMAFFGAHFLVACVRVFVTVRRTLRTRQRLSLYIV